MRLAVLACVLLLAPRLHAADDCQSVMAMLSSAQQRVQSGMEAISALESAIDAPSWDPVSDGWMVDALGWAISDLVGDLNDAAVAEERAHEAHCY